MERIFLKVDGGIGRCISSTGAVEKYALENSDKEVNVVSSFNYVFDGLEGINRVYPIGTPFLYEDHIKNGEFVEPEPYNDSSYYREEKHIASVFNKLLNGDDSFIAPKMIFNDNELAEAKGFIDSMKQETGKKVVLIQPWGSQGGKIIKDEKGEEKIMVDESYRSFGSGFAKKLNDRLVEEGFIPFYIKNPDQAGFKDGKTFNGLPVRKLIALIPFVDGVIACDSFLHHASASLGSPVPTIVLWGATSDKNLGYEEQVNFKSDKKVFYEPNRIPHDHSFYVNKNKGCNEFKLELVDNILEVLKNGNKTKKDSKE
jgi:hypothetical protein